MDQCQSIKGIWCEFMAKLILNIAKLYEYRHWALLHNQLIQQPLILISTQQIHIIWVCIFAVRRFVWTIIISVCMRNILLMILLIPGISIIFAYTKANIWSFWLGIILSLFLQFFICLAYCFIKVQGAYRQTFTVKLQQKYNMNLQKDYPFPPFVVGDKFYLNRYTQQAFLNNKKQVFKSSALEEKLQDFTFNQVSCKKEIQEYIDQMRQKYKYLNKFNQALILFGRRVTNVSDCSFLIKTIYSFAEKETYFKDNAFSSEFREEERRAFNELKIKLKSPKVTNALIGKVGEGGNEEIVLPTWKMILQTLQRVGKQFQEIEQMKQSNTEVLQLISKKMIQEYEIVQNQMSDTVKSLEEIRQNLQNLKEEQRKLDKYETKVGSNQDNSELIYWLKKQYFQFTNLTLRIKQNENNYKRGIQKMRYYTSKIKSFYKQQKDKYDSIVITRYISFLDTYFISLEESLKGLQRIFSQEGYAYKLQKSGPPKVKQMIKSKNMDQVLSAELNYHEEYFERVEYYKNKIEVILQSLQSLDMFLSRLKAIYNELVNNLNPNNTHNRGSQTIYFKILYEQLSSQSRRIYDIISNLQAVNLALYKENKGQLQEMQRKVMVGLQESSSILLRLKAHEGPLREKYKLVKANLTQIYKEMEQVVGSIKYFQEVYQKHQNRVKKILLVSFIQFINYQKKMICNQGEGDYIRRNVDIADVNLEDVNMLDASKIDLTEDYSYENQNRLETGYLLSEEYKSLLNRFLFVAYTEWSQSQLFRATISKEIYIALNEDHNQSFAEINIDDFQLSGQPPELIWVKQLNSEQDQFLADLNIAFRGKIVMKISTTYITLINIPIELEISIQEFFSVLRICFISNHKGCSWFSFIGEPIAKVIINPRLGSLQINFDSIVNMFQSIILNKLKENVYPIKKRISIPLYKKDDNYQTIQNRFRFGAEV